MNCGVLSWLNPVVSGVLSKVHAAAQGNRADIMMGLHAAMNSFAHCSCGASRFQLCCNPSAHRQIPAALLACG